MSRLKKFFLGAAIFTAMGGGITAIDNAANDKNDSVAAGAVGGAFSGIVIGAVVLGGKRSPAPWARARTLGL